MKKVSAKTYIPVILLAAVVIALAVLTVYAMSLKSVSETAPDAISKVSDAETGGRELRTAVPETPSPTHLPLSSADTLFAEDTAAEPAYPFWSEGSLFLGNVYRSPTLYVCVTVHNDPKLFGRPLVFYVADIYVSDVTQIRTACESNDFQNAGRGWVKQMANRENALVAISGDYCGNRLGAVIIRNGEVYRAKINSYDICLLLRNGEMETMASADTSISEILDKDPWQAWEFGPYLIDSNGEPRKDYTGVRNKPQNPRTCIGYYEPGHYCFVVVDGRQAASRGLSLVELAVLMHRLGCKQAFNLDGGGSAHFYWKDRILNSPSGGGRKISDIIYIAKESYNESGFYCGKAGSSE